MSSVAAVVVVPEVLARVVNAVVVPVAVLCLIWLSRGGGAGGGRMPRRRLQYEELQQKK